LNIAVFGARPRADQYAVDTKSVLGEFALAVGADFVREETASLAMTGKLQALTFNAGGDRHGGTSVAWPLGSPRSIPENMLHRSILKRERVAVAERQKRE
jgi:hypothetical protein